MQIIQENIDKIWVGFLFCFIVLFYRFRNMSKFNAIELIIENNSTKLFTYFSNIETQLEKKNHYEEQTRTTTTKKSYAMLMLRFKLSFATFALMLTGLTCLRELNFWLFSADIHFYNSLFHLVRS